MSNIVPFMKQEEAINKQACIYLFEHTIQYNDKPKAIAIIRMHNGMRYLEWGEDVNCLILYFPITPIIKYIVIFHISFT